MAPSYIERLALLGKALGEGSITLLVDNVAHIELMQKFKGIAGFAPYIMPKVDTGYGRAGIPPSEDELGELAEVAAKSEAEGNCNIHGVYSHSGHSYSGESQEDGMKYLLEEMQRNADAATIVRKHLQINKDRRLIVSVGASPSATSVQNLLGTENSVNTSSTAQGIRKTLKETFENGLSIELHAGVYSLLVSLKFL